MQHFFLPCNKLVSLIPGRKKPPSVVENHCKHVRVQYFMFFSLYHRSDYLRQSTYIRVLLPTLNPLRQLVRWYLHSTAIQYEQYVAYLTLDHRARSEYMQVHACTHFLFIYVLAIFVLLMSLSWIQWKTRGWLFFMPGFCCNSRT